MRPLRRRVYPCKTRAALLRTPRSSFSWHARIKPRVRKRDTVRITDWVEARVVHVDDPPPRVRSDP